MPNWCNNFIRITGDEDKIKKIAKLIKQSQKSEGDDSSGLFITLVGLPEGMSPDEYNKDWWDTNISTWGTKWDVNVSIGDNVEVYPNEITISIETAWSPPIPFCQSVAEMFGVEVHIVYDEPGVAFAGETYCHPDGTQEDTEYPYNEGIYRLDSCQFFESVVPNHLEYLAEEVECDESINPIEKIKEEFDFCTEEEINEIIEQYNEEYATNDN